MKCFLHIGTEKTATTTIQKFLDLNRDILFKKRFIYTKSAGKTNNRQLPVAAYDLSRRDDATINSSLNTEARLASFQKKIIVELKEEIKTKVRGQTDFTVIFSSEHLQSRLTSVDEVERLRSILIELGMTDISIIVYLRNPAEIANSLFSTAIKCGGLSKCPPGPLETPYYENICNHKKTIEKFSTVFGKKSVIPRIFDKKVFIDGSIINDFLHVIGIEANERYKIPKKANESLSITGINIMRIVNKKIPRFIDGKPNPVRANILKYLEEHFSENKYVMPNKLYTEYDTVFSKSNEWVRNNYFPDLSCLFPAIPFVKESKSDIPLEDLERISNFIIDIWIDKQSMINQLQENNI